MSGNPQQDTSNDILYIMAFVLLILAGVVFFFGDYLLVAHLWLRSRWLDIISMLGMGDRDSLHRAQQMLSGYQSNEWTLDRLRFLSGQLRTFFFVPMAAALVLVAWRAHKKNPLPRFRRVHSTATLAAVQSKDWPWTTPALGLNILSMPVTSGPWAMALNPVELAKRYHLLDGKALNRPRAEKFYALQLGQLWRGPMALSLPLRALYACFIAQVCGDMSACAKGLERLARSSAPALTATANKSGQRGKQGSLAAQLDTGFVQEYLDRYNDNPDVQAVCGRHAYEVTVMCGMLETARKNGVLPPNYFLWLRPMRRTWWYALQSMGRRTSFPEAGGIHAHYQSEVIAGRGLERPYIIEAVEALEKAISEIKFD